MLCDEDGCCIDRLIDLKFMSGKRMLSQKELFMKLVVELRLGRR